MSFISPLFFLFVGVVVGVNYFLPSKFRHPFLLLSSFVFIGFYNIESVVALLLFSIFNFYLARFINANRFLYWLGIIINAGAILLFNYFIAGNRFTVSFINFQVDKLLLALGLSYYSIQNIAYLTEVYKQRMSPETNLSKFMLYHCFFPKIVSGPIVLPAEFIPQIGTVAISNKALISGLQLVLLGVFKKMAIADRLASGVGSIFDFHSNYSGLTVLVGAYLFSIQLYFDFSGYSDMAVGISKMLGYTIKDNFNLPFRSLSITEFWRRWHISLLSWLTTYIYFPIVFRFRQMKKFALYLGILLTFFVSMLWHGIGFTFLAYVLCHTIYLSIETLTRGMRAKLFTGYNSYVFKIACAFIVFNAFSFANLFFRASSFDVSLQLIHNLFFNFLPANFMTDFISPLAVGGHQIDEFNFILSIILFTSFILFEQRINKVAKSEFFNFKYLSIVILLIMLFGVFNSGTRFIYMQF